MVAYLPVMISAAMLESYLLPSTMPGGRSGEAIPHSGSSWQAYFGYFVTRTFKFGRPNSSVSVLSHIDSGSSVRSPWVGQTVCCSVSFRGDFIAGKMRRQALVTLLAWPAALMLGNRLLQIFDRVGQSRGRVGCFIRVAEVQSQLVRVVDITFAAVAKALLHQLVEGQLILITLLLQLRDLSRPSSAMRYLVGAVAQRAALSTGRSSCSFESDARSFMMPTL